MSENILLESYLLDLQIKQSIKQEFFSNVKYKLIGVSILLAIIGIGAISKFFDNKKRTKFFESYNKSIQNIINSNLTLLQDKVFKLTTSLYKEFIKYDLKEYINKLNNNISSDYNSEEIDSLKNLKDKAFIQDKVDNIFYSELSSIKDFIYYKKKIPNEKNIYKVNFLDYQSFGALVDLIPSEKVTIKPLKIKIENSEKKIQNLFNIILLKIIKEFADIY